MKLRVARNLKRKSDRPVTLRVSRDLLKSAAVQSDFLDAVEKSNPSLSLSEKVQSAAKATLSSSERAQPGWFQQNEAELLKLIAERNTAAGNFMRLNQAGKEKPVAAHQELKKVRRSKSKGCAGRSRCKRKWFDSKVNDLKNGNQHPKQYWDAVRDLKKGISDTRPSPNTMYLNSDSS